MGRLSKIDIWCFERASSLPFVSSFVFFDAGYHSNIKKSKHQDSSFSQGLRKPEGKLQSHKNKVALRLLLRVVSCLIYANANVFSSEIFKNGRLLQLRIRRW